MIRHDRNHEILIILQEECAEVSQIISKIFRFGMIDSLQLEGETNKERLVKEIGDLEAMVGLLKEHVLFDSDIKEIDNARERKLEKLKTWSNIFKD